MLESVKKFFGQAEEEPSVSASPSLSVEEQLVRQLDLLAELQSQQENLEKPFQARLKKLEKEVAEALGDLPTRIGDLKKKCQSLGVLAGKNVFGAELKAEYVSGSLKADVKGLQGYAVDHPEVAKFIYTDDPCCRIKAISKKEREILDRQDRAKKEAAI